MPENNGKFTLGQLLILIALVSILLAIMFPALQRNREASNQTTCKNNIRQIALASHNYESAHMELPAGFVENWQYAYLSTFNSITPFMEEGSTWPLIPDRAEDKQIYWFDEVDPNLPTPLREYEFFHCPSMPIPLEIHSPWAPSPVPAHARTDYAFCAGFWGNQPGDQPQAGAWAADFFTWEPQTMGGFVDGTSSTLLAGESIGDAEDNVRLNCHSYNSYFTGIHINDAYHPEYSWIDPYISAFLTSDGVRHTTRDQFSSPHPSGVNFAFCDGSVHCIPRTIDTKILAALATADQGDSIDDK